jgi:hypothetical protein
MGDEIEGREPGRLATFLDAEFTSELADEAPLAVPLGELAR